MVVRNTDTNPKLSSERLKHILMLESEIDLHLLRRCYGEKTSYMLMCEKEVTEIIITRYTRAGWDVRIAYSGENTHRLEFIDPEQLVQEHQD